MKKSIQENLKKETCTHINAKGELEVLNRKYEALLIEVISSKDSVGLLRIDPEIEIIKE